MKLHDWKYLAFHASKLNEALSPPPGRLSVAVVGYFLKLFFVVAALLLVVNFVEQAQAADWKGLVKTTGSGIFLICIAILVGVTSKAMSGDEKSSTRE